MELANPIYPMRSVIRCKAKHQLMTSVDGESMVEALDQTLFKELAATLFRSGQCAALYQPCYSKAEACAVEDWVAMELAVTYQRIVQQRQNPAVQALNTLL